MRALLVERLVHRFAAAADRLGVAGSGAGIAVGPLRLGEIDPPSLPGPRLAPGHAPPLRDLRHRTSRRSTGRARISSRTSSRFPFVPGHEVVGVVTDGPDAGRRVVIEPVLSCVVRGIEPLCPSCAVGRTGALRTDRLRSPAPGTADGLLRGHRRRVVRRAGGRHEAQLHLVPDEMRDEAAVMVEPAACAVHAALARPGSVPGERRRRPRRRDGRALHARGPPARTRCPRHCCRVAKYPVQQTVRRGLRCRRGRRAGRARPGGAPHDRDTRLGVHRGRDRAPRRRARTSSSTASGSARSIAEALEVVRPGGRIVLVGMPGIVRVDLAPLWQREVALVGAYAYGTEDVPRAPTDLRARLRARREAAARAARLRPLPSGTLRGSVRHAASAGRRGSVKMVFDIRREDPGWRRPAVSAASKRRVPRGTRDWRRACEPEARIRTRGRPVDTPDAVLARRGLPVRAAARGLPGRLRRPSPSTGWPTPMPPIRHALEHPLGDTAPLSALLRPGMRLTIAFDDVSLPLPPMRRPDIRQRVIEAVLDVAAAAGVDDVVLIAALALHRRMTDDELRHALGDRVFDAFAPHGLLLQHDAEDPERPRPPRHDRKGRGRRDQPARRRERPSRLRQHQPCPRWTAATSPSRRGSPATGASVTTTT